MSETWKAYTVLSTDPFSLLPTLRYSCKWGKGSFGMGNVTKPLRLCFILSICDSYRTEVRHKQAWICSTGLRRCHSINRQFSHVCVAELQVSQSVQRNTQQCSFYLVPLLQFGMRALHKNIGFERHLTQLIFQNIILGYLCCGRNSFCSLISTHGKLSVNIWQR